MPGVDSDRFKSSWADQVEEGEDEDVRLPSLPEIPEDGLKTVIEFKEIDGKKCKIIRKFRVEKHMVSKSIAKRKTWHKFGGASNDPPGPNPTNTIAAEDVFLQFITNKEAMQEQKPSDDDPLKNAKNVVCRICKEDHWTVKCPYKDTLGPLQSTLKAEEKKPAPGAPGQDDKTKSGKYVPPNMREGGNRRGESMQSSSRDESATIRVTNLSEDVREADLQLLFRPFGTIQRYYLAMDKSTQQSKGFAFVTFHRKEDAAKAILTLDGYGYDHLILNVEWAKPPAAQ